MTEPKRPMLTSEDRARLRRLASQAQKRGERSGTSQAYYKGVADVLTWLDSAEMSPMLKEVFR